MIFNLGPEMAGFLTVTALVILYLWYVFIEFFFELRQQNREQ